MVRSPAQILDAVSQLIDAEPDIAETLRIRFVGKFPQEYERMLEDTGLVEILRVDGYLNHRQAVAAMIESDLLFLMQAGEGSECFIPGKLYEYIRSGTPIIGLFLEGLAPALIRESGCGVVIAPGDVESIRTHIRNFHFAWKQGRSLINPKDTFIKQFTREKQSMAYSDWLTSIRRLQH